jgi:hypothetical protein
VNPKTEVNPTYEGMRQQLLRCPNIRNPEQPEGKLLLDLAVLFSNGLFNPVHLSCEPYYFSERTVFFSHNKSANSIFSHDFSAKRTCLEKMAVQFDG